MGRCSIRIPSCCLVVGISTFRTITLGSSKMKVKVNTWVERRVRLNPSICLAIRLLVTSGWVGLWYKLSATVVRTLSDSCDIYCEYNTDTYSFSVFCFHRIDHLAQMKWNGLKIVRSTFNLYPSGSVIIEDWAYYWFETVESRKTG